MKKILLWLLVILVGISMLATLSLVGCKTTTAATETTAAGETTTAAVKKETPKKLTVWMQKQLTEDANQIMEERCIQFGKEKNVEVNIEFVAYEDAFTKWSAAIESKQTPDVSFLGFQEAGQYNKKGLLVDVTELIKRIEEKNGPIYDSLKNVAASNGKQYAIPQWASGTVLYYRKDLLEKAGYSEPPKTWEEFREIAKATTDASKGIYGAGIGFGKADSDAEWLTRSLIWSYGGAEVDKDGKTVIINSPETIQAVKLFTDMFLVDKSTPPSAIGWDDSANNKAYLSGQAVMVVNTGSVLNAMKNDNPELLEKTGIAPLPAGPKGTFIPGICTVVGIFNNTENVDLSEEFIEYIYDKDWYESWIEGSLPMSTPVLSDLEKTTAWQDPLNKAFAEETKNFVFLGYRGEFSAEAGEVYNLKLMNDAFQRVIVDKYTPEKAVEELQKKIEEVYNK